MIKVKFKKLDDFAKVPTKAHETDAAYDLTAVNVRVDDYGHIIYETGLAVEIPAGYAGYIYPRSSVRKHGLMMTNSVGVIDAGYRGELQVTFTPEECNISLWGLIKLAVGMKMKNKNLLYNFKPYEIGERVAQLVIRTAPKVQWLEAEELSDSERGEGGHGSTGQ